MSEMIERAAKAMYLSRYDGPTVEGQPTADSYWPDRLDEFVSGPPFDADGYRSMAKAVIAAMREPTEEMKEAGLEHTGDPCWQEDVGKAWRAMIDEALGKVTS